MAKGSEIDGVEFIDNFQEFSDRSDLILANRFDEKLKRVVEKVYTRDIYLRD